MDDEIQPPPLPRLDWWLMAPYLPHLGGVKHRVGVSPKVKAKRREATKRARKARRKNR